VLAAAGRLTYRSLISISVILEARDPFPDTWIYVHSPEVRLGRIQNFRAWSPYMVPDGDHVALGLEYFCTEGDELWGTPDDELIAMALAELERIGLGKADSFVDGFVSRVPKAYPTYDASYPADIKVVRAYLHTLKNLQPIGRYGMFRYNNMDHSILTGIYAARNVLGEGAYDVWEVNADEDYHEAAAG
jgi:protoporphyrinogen oxidase